MIPAIYRDYYRTGGGADMLARVFYHNLQDIVSMALLGARLAGLFQPDRLEEILTGLHPLECMSLARCYEALDWTEAGIAAYRMAHATLPDDDGKAAALRQLGFLYKRLGRQEDAAAVWEEWLSGLTGGDLTPYIELAKHHEWRTLDLEAARGWAGWALHIAERWPPGAARDDAIGDLQRRIARLERKLRDRDATPVSGESFDKA
jgi:tetratricopeptide (TPR) repeat protein